MATTITDVLNDWADIGIFAYVLPFLMIFAIIYGILVKTEILGNNKGVNATIALAAGLLALQFDYVSNFFASIFPFAGIGLAILLVAIIFTGLLINIDDDKAKKVYNWILFGLGTIIFVAVLLTSLADFRWWGGMGMGWGESWPAIFAAIVVLALIFWVIFAGGGAKKNEKEK